jgi:hypothetical protein
MNSTMKQLLLTSFLLVVHALTVEAQVTNSGNLKLFSGASVTFFGNVTNNGTLIDSGTVVTLAGSSASTIDGSSVTTFNNLTLNNTSATGVTLGQAMNVRGALVLTDGYLYTTASNVLTLANGATTSGAGNGSFVSGPMAKTGNQSFTFPVGKGVAYAPIAISAPGLATDKFTAEYIQTSPNALYNVSSLDGTLNHVSQCEYWMLDRTTGTSNVTVNLSWDTRSCGVTNLSDLRVAGWNGTQWVNKGNGGTTGTTTAGTVVSSPVVTVFGPFTLGSVSSDNPLPVELVSFSAQCEETHAVLRWSTASELNNDYFTIESSIDAEDWATAGTIEGAGNSTTLLHYTYTDAANAGRNLYYRLKQTDTDGKYTYHDILYLESCRGAAGGNSVTLYPNPAQNNVTIVAEEEVLSVTVYNSEGKTIGNIGVNLLAKTMDFSQVPEGVYFVEIATPGKVFNQRLIVSGR